MANQYLYTVPYKELSKWYIELYLNRRLIKSIYECIQLGKIIFPYGNVVTKDNYNIEIPIVDKIRFSDGKVFFREKNETNMNVYYCENGDLLVSKINFHQGAIAINSFGLIACTTHYQPYKINTEIVIPEYLLLTLRSEYFIAFISGIKAQGIKNESGYDFIKELKIPIPPIEKQKELVNEYNSAMKYAEAIKPSCSWRLVEKQMNEFLQLKTTKSEIEGDFLATIKYSSLLTWDVKNRQGYELFETDKYDSVMLNNLVEINPKLSRQLKDDDTVSFVPMECVSDFDGSVKEYRTCKYSTKGFTKFEDGDIIWAKITPCMQNGKSAIVNGMKNGVGYGSTEFYVLRRKSDKVLTEYLYYILRSIKVRTEAVNYFSGSAGQQRVRKSFLQELRIPLPSLQEQKELVALLDEKKNKMNDKQAEYQNIRQQAKQNFETAIFN